MTFDTIQTIPVSPALGAEIGGVDLSQSLGDDVIAEIRQAWLEYRVVFFRDQDITPEQHLAFARRFGDLVTYPMVKGLDDYPEIAPVIKLEHQTVNFGGIWHSDTTYLPQPPMGAILVARELPPKGGDTLFANMQAAYEHLDDQTKARLEGLTVIHSHDYIISLSSELSRRQDQGEYTELPPVSHPLARVHPETGQRSLFLSPHTMVAIEQLPDPEGRALLDRLIEHATQNRFVYRHRWREHDVIMWDNRCTMHMVTPFDNQAQRRIMHRTTIVGDDAPIPARSVT